MVCSEPSVFTWPTRCLTIPRSTRNDCPSQSTSSHFKAKASLMRSPNDTQTKATVRTGSAG